MNTFIAQDGQTLMDICLNVYLTLDYLVKLCKDNGILGVNTPVVSGQAFLYDPTITADQSVAIQNQQQKIIYATRSTINYQLGTGGDFNDDFSNDFNI
jgi:hypothetical protein